jgi:hypothetical protein
LVHFKAPVAQGIERRIPNPQVAGSIPAGGTKKIKRVFDCDPPVGDTMLPNTHGGAMGGRPSVEFYVDVNEPVRSSGEFSIPPNTHGAAMGYSDAAPYGAGWVFHQRGFFTPGACGAVGAQNFEPWLDLSSQGSVEMTIPR